MLALLGYGGSVLRHAMTLGGLEQVVMALGFNVAAGRGHVVGAVRFPVAVRRRGSELVGIETLAAFLGGGHVGHLDVWDAGLHQDQRRVGQLHLLHVVDGQSSVNGLL